MTDRNPPLLELSLELATLLEEQRRRVFHPTSEELEQGKKRLAKLSRRMGFWEDDGTQIEGYPNAEHSTYWGKP